MAKGLVAESGAGSSGAAQMAIEDLVEAPAEDPTQGRVPAPEITTQDLQELRRDPRWDITERLDEENPDYKHSFQKASITPEILKRKGMELVEGEHHFEDPVAREPIEVYNRRREIEGLMSVDTVERITDPENDIYKMRQPKKPHRPRRRRTR